MKTNPACPRRLSVPQWRPQFVLTLLLAAIISACGGGGGGTTPGGGGGGTTPPPTSAPDSGAVYVFTRDAAGVWSQQAYIKASNTDAGDKFVVIALSGDTLAVGAIGEDSAATGINGDQSDNSANAAGAAYVFTRDGAGIWSQQAYIKASNTEAEDRFGSVVVSGDTLVVNHIFDDSAATGINGDQSDNTAANAGAVHVFTRDGAGIWSQQAYIKASNADAGDLFGSRLEISGDTLVVGASDEDSAATGIDGDQSDNAAVDASATYMFTRDPAGTWSQQAYIKASNTDAGDKFVSIALSGDRLAVGSRQEDSAATGINGDQSDNSAAGAGAVYAFTRDAAGVWSQQAYIKASSTEAGDAFGASVEISGDTIAVGGQGEDSAATGIDGDQSDNSASFSGAVHVFTDDGTGVWSQQAYIKASNTDAGDEFGSRVALWGDTLAVGADGEDSAATGVDGDQGNTGFSGIVVAVHAFDGKPTQDANLTGNEVIPVAVLGSVNFDATQVDFSTAVYGPGRASPIHDGHVKDVNHDGIFDMLFHFKTQETDIACGDFNATLSGETFGGEAFTGTDLVKTAGC